jgi:hypothetical protein
MISHILSLPEAFPGAPLIFFFFGLALETLLILILVLSQKMRGNRLLIPDVPHLFFGNIVPDEDMTNTLMTKAQAKIEFKAQSTLKSDLFASPVRTAGAGIAKTDAQAISLYWQL